eukprot:scaffold109758_cov59-Phaeocystis_antarctica.AAC.3
MNTWSRIARDTFAKRQFTPHLQPEPGAAGYSVSNSMQFSGPRLVKSSHLVLVSMCTARCPSGLGAGASTGA